MNSLRARFLTLFLLGFGILWIASSTAIYFSYREGLLTGQKSELQTLLRQLRMTYMHTQNTTPSGPSPLEHPATIPSPNLPEGVYWEIRPADGSPPLRSPGLPQELPHLTPGKAEVLFLPVQLPDGTPAFMAAGDFGMGQRATQISVIKDLSSLQNRLKRLLLTLLTLGGFLFVLSGLVVTAVVKHCLSPLDRLARQVSEINVDSLNQRLSATDASEEIKPVVERLNQLFARLETSFERERQFSADLSHEMKTPIAELRVMVESALRWPEEGGTDSWQSALESVKRMESVVSAMLLLSRLDQSKPHSTPNPSEHNLKELLESVWTPLEAIAQNRHLTLDMQVDPSVRIYGDSELWTLIFSNLLSNAVSHAPEGSPIQIQSKNFHSQKSPDLFFTNPAPNLTSSDLENLFHRFWKSDPSRSDSNHFGLGLPIARSACEALGWNLSARFTPQKQDLEFHLSPGS